MDSLTFRALLSPAGQDVIQAAAALSPRESDFLLHYQSLNRLYPPSLARAALEIAILRHEAAGKFPFAERLYLTRQAFEQASSNEVSSYRAERFRPFRHIFDLGCSIGADTFSLSKIAFTTGIDIDPLRLSMASANLLALGLQAHANLVQADLTQGLPVRPGSGALFFDPARRINHRRVFTVEQYQPPLSILKDWLPNFKAIGVKISPGVDLSEISSYEAEVEFISLRGELKEAVLWFGPLKSAFRTATVLPGPHKLAAQHETEILSATPNLSPPKTYLYEPDPAILRASLVTLLAEQLPATQLDPDIAYLTSDRLFSTPFARVWTIEEWFPFQLKKLRAYLRQHNIGRITIKKRGSPLEPEDLTRNLRLEGDQSRILVLTHLRGEPIVLICNAL